MNVDLSGIDSVRSGVQAVEATAADVRRAEAVAKISFDNITSIWKSVYAAHVREGCNNSVASINADRAVTNFLKQGWNPASGLRTAPKVSPEQPVVQATDPYIEALQATLSEANALIASMEGSLPIELREAVIAYRNKAKERSTELRRLQEQSDLARLTVVQERTPF